MIHIKKIKLSDNMKGVLFSVAVCAAFFLSYGFIKDISGAKTIELQWHRDVDVIISNIYNRLFG